jgi:hypothetical protein
VGVDVRVEFPAQMPQSKLSFLRLSNIRSLGVLPSWLSQLPMELFSLSNVTVGVPPSWFQGALWTDTIKRFELLDIQITRLPRFEFPTTTIVSIQ